MKWIYILIMLAIAVFTLGCVDKELAETSTEPPVLTDSQGGSATPAAIPSETLQTPAPGEDIFGTYDDLALIDNISSDLDMQIALSTEI